MSFLAGYTHFSMSDRGKECSCYIEQHFDPNKKILTFSGSLEKTVGSVMKVTLTFWGQEAGSALRGRFSLTSSDNVLLQSGILSAKLIQDKWHLYPQGYGNDETWYLTRQL